MPFPIDDEDLCTDFAERPSEEVLVIDDKREQTENAFKRICFDWSESKRPAHRWAI